MPPLRFAIRPIRTALRIRGIYRRNVPARPCSPPSKILFRRRQAATSHRPHKPPRPRESARSAATKDGSVELRSGSFRVVPTPLAWPVAMPVRTPPLARKSSRPLARSPFPIFRKPRLPLAAVHPPPGVALQVHPEKLPAPANLATTQRVSLRPQRLPAPNRLPVPKPPLHRPASPPILSAAIPSSSSPAQSIAASARRTHAPTPRCRQAVRLALAVVLPAKKYPRFRRAPRTAPATPPSPSAHSRSHPDAPENPAAAHPHLFPARASTLHSRFLRGTAKVPMPPVQSPAKFLPPQAGTA